MLLSLFLAPLANAQEVSFEAYIDRENVSSGETFQVKLELVGVEAQSAPDLAVIPSECHILGQQQQASVTYVNGVQAQNLSWVLDLVCDNEGTYKIPEIGIKTPAGDLYTKPFKIFVKPASQLQSATSDNSVFIDVQLEKTDPFIDEPVLYKTTVYHLGDIQNAELVKPKAANAIVEQVSEPRPSRQILNGVNYKVIEVEYIITPVQTGEIKIEPSILRGKIAKAQAQATPMDALFAPFGNIGMPMREYVPFTVASKETTIEVKPADAGVNPWLVLYDMQIDDELGDVQYDQTNERVLAKAGEPISRRVRITAHGKSGEGLPEIGDAFNSPDFKVYADKAEFTKEIEVGDGPIASRIKGTKMQTFTFIPQKTGMLTLPELNIAYWSLKDNVITKANLPGKVITAVPSDKAIVNEQPKATPTAPVAQQQPEATEQEPQTFESKFESISNSPQMPNLVLLMLCFFMCIVIFISFKILTSAKKNKQDFDEELVNPKPKQKNADASGLGRRKIINLNKKNAPMSNSNYIVRIHGANNHHELQQVLQNFAEQHLNVPANSGTVIIANAMSNKFRIDKQAAMKYAAELDSVLYAGKQIDLEYLKNAFADIISQIESNIDSSSAKDDNDKLISLNP